MAVAVADFFEHIDDFIDYRKVIYEASEQTLRSNRIDIGLFEEFVNERNYQIIDGTVAMAFQYYLKKERLNSGGSINRKIFTLRSYSSFLKLEELESVETLPFYDVTKIRTGYRNQPDALTLEQIKSIFEVIDRNTFLGIRDYAVYALMYDLGLRVGEVHSLNIENIDFKKDKITVTGKGNKTRVLFLTNQMREILIEWLGVRNNFLNSDKTTALFISKKGNRLAIRTIEDNLKKILKKAELDTHFNVTPHTFRHSFASHLNDHEVKTLVIQSLLGHSSPRSTEIYIHPAEKRCREAMERLPGILYVKEVIASGKYNFSFQTAYGQRRE